MLFRKAIPALVFFIATLLGTQAQNSVTLEISLEKALEGTVFVALYNQAEGFMEISKSYKTSSKVLKGQATRIILTDLPAGDYAISTYLDQNGNEELDTNFLGIPKEPYGFSNNARGKLSAPSYEQCKFSLSGSSKTLAITLK